jgi:hypothetical protein
MIELDLDALRSEIDLENKYVDFSLIRTSLTVERVVSDLDVILSAPTKEGECRATACPKCSKERSFVLNINTNRFNCFNKGCFLKGGGVIDFVARLYEIPAKEASHLLACVYGIQPYDSAAGAGGIIPGREAAAVTASPAEQPPPATAKTEPSATREQSREAGVISRAEFEKLEQKVERLSTIVWSILFERSEIEETDQLFDEETDDELERAILSSAV